MWENQETTRPPRYAGAAASDNSVAVKNVNFSVAP